MPLSDGNVSLSVVDVTVPRDVDQLVAPAEASAPAVVPMDIESGPDDGVGFDFDDTKKLITASVSTMISRSLVFQTSKMMQLKTMTNIRQMSCNNTHPAQQAWLSNRDKEAIESLRSGTSLNRTSPRIGGWKKIPTTPGQRKEQLC